MVKAVFFDWDGTLFDVFDFLVDTYTKVFKEFDIEPWEREEYRHKFKCDWRKLLEDMGLKEHEEYLINQWNEEKKRKEKHLTLHENALKTVENLSKDFRLAIVSSAPKDTLNAEAERLKIKSFMETIIAYDDTPNSKPHPEPLLEACSQMDLKPENCVYVGDMREDIKSAKVADLKSIGVSWGIHSPEVILEENPDKIVYSFDELTEYIKNLP